MENTNIKSNYRPHYLFDIKDVEFSSFRYAGGGQVTGPRSAESEVRLWHIPTGINVICHESRSKNQNREQALNMLNFKIAEESFKSVYFSLFFDEAKKRFAETYRQFHVEISKTISGSIFSLDFQGMAIFMEAIEDRDKLITMLGDHVNKLVNSMIADNPTAYIPEAKEINDLKSAMAKKEGAIKGPITSYDVIHVDFGKSPETERKSTPEKTRGEYWNEWLGFSAEEVFQPKYASHKCYKCNGKNITNLPYQPWTNTSKCDDCGYYTYIVHADLQGGALSEDVAISPKLSEKFIGENPQPAVDNKK